MTEPGGFTPAAERFAPTSVYDRGVALLTKESVWRSELLRRLLPAPGDSILDVGCGTGSLAILFKQAGPEARIMGLDPDTVTLPVAETKCALLHKQPGDRYIALVAVIAAHPSGVAAPRGHRNFALVPDLHRDAQKPHAIGLSFREIARTDVDLNRRQQQLGR